MACREAIVGLKSKVEDVVVELDEKGKHGQRHELTAVVDAKVNERMERCRQEASSFDHRPRALSLGPTLPIGCCNLWSIDFLSTLS